MRREKGTLLLLASGGMELSWLYAWATFLTMTTLHQSFPFKEAISAFILATIFTLLSKGKGWRIVYILGLQGFGFILTALRIVYAFDSRSYSFWDHTWLVQFFSTPRDPLEWLALSIFLFWAVMFWFGGVALARRSLAYPTICSRFDFGIVAFFVLFLTRFLLAKEGIKVQEPISQLLLFSFFVFSLLAIGLARNRSVATKDFLPGYQSIGLIISFAVAVLLFSTGSILFFFPYLTAAADMGHVIIKRIADPLGPILVSVIRFLLMHGTVRPEKTSPQTEESIRDFVSSGESSWWTELLEKILGWVFGTILGLALLIMLSLAILYLVRWLLSRSPVGQKRPGLWYLVSFWALRFQAFLVLCWRKLVRGVKGYKGAIQLYAALLSWGRHSGLPYFLSETPSEYGLRLQNRFTLLKREIGLIVEAFNQEVYGEITIDNEQWIVALSAWRRLHSPMHWPLRLRTWFFHSTYSPEAIQYHSLDRNSIS